MENIYLLQYGIIGTKKIINNVMNPETDKQLLDPLSSIIRLALLAYKEKHTKISISHNKIYFQPPNIMQGTMRWTNGDGRDDLKNLCHTIEIALLWYDPNNNKNIQNIFKMSIKGLNKLKDAYTVQGSKVSNSNLVCHSILHYTDLIERKLSSLIDDKDEKNISPAITEEYKYFKNLWKDGEIEIINNLFILINDKRNNDEEYVYAINAIEAILQEKDDIIKKILHKKDTF